MYIHAYQVDNVLNVYRKQLSEKTKPRIAAPSTSKPTDADRVSLSDEAQKRTIINQVSEDIIRRLATYGHQGQSDNPVDPYKDNGADMGVPKRTCNEVEFTYTMIDENDRKTTNRYMVKAMEPTEQSAGQHIQEGE